MKNEKLFGTLIATAIAGALASGNALADHKAGHKGKTMGCLEKLDCKGQAACAGVRKEGKNECKGKNDCGGWHYLTQVKDEAACKEMKKEWKAVPKDLLGHAEKHDKKEEKKEEKHEG